MPPAPPSTNARTKLPSVGAMLLVVKAELSLVLVPDVRSVRATTSLPYSESWHDIRRVGAEQDRIGEIKPMK
jgi:hypothetical protein